ncbi:MAG TPA: hypothetical protein VI408_16350 [Gaiellaceae bacterium]
MNWHSKRAVLALIGAACVVVFVAGMAAAWNNRHHTICRDGRPPKQQQGGILGQVVYKCHDGQIVTTPG